MALGKKLDAVKELGGGKVALRECSSAGVGTGSWLPVGYVSGTTITDSTTVNTTNDEAGKPIYTKGNREVTFQVNNMQIDKDTLVFATETARDKFYQVGYEMTESAIEGNYQYIFFGITQLDPMMERSSPGTDGPAWTFRASAAEADVTVDASGWTQATQTLSSYTITAASNNPYYTIETVAT